MAAECSGRLSDDELLSIDSQDDTRLQKAIREKFQDGEPINILVTGKFKVGKSTLINTLFYKEGEPYEIAEDGFFDPTTEEVVPYQFETNGIVYNIYDSPGLQDGKDGKKDTTYLNQKNVPSSTSLSIPQGLTIHFGTTTGEHYVTCIQCSQKISCKTQLLH